MEQVRVEKEKRVEFHNKIGNCEKQALKQEDHLKTLLNEKEHTKEML